MFFKNMSDNKTSPTPLWNTYVYKNSLNYGTYIK